MIAQRYLDLLRELSTDESSHSKGRTLFEHLKGTYELLEKWDNPIDVCLGGLFHSIYGPNTTRFNLRILLIENISPAL